MFYALITREKDGETLFRLYSRTPRVQASTRAISGYSVIGVCSGVTTIGRLDARIVLCDSENAFERVRACVRYVPLLFYSTFKRPYQRVSECANVRQRLSVYVRERACEQEKEREREEGGVIELSRLSVCTVRARGMLPSYERASARLCV